MNSNNCINIKNLIDTLITENGKNTALYHFIKNNMITEKKYYDRLIHFFLKNKNLYLAGEISKNLCDNFLKIVQNQKQNIKDVETRDNTTVINFKINELRNLEKEYSNILSKTINYFEEILLFEIAGNFLEEHANLIYEESKYHDEQSKLFINKSVFEDAKRSMHTSKYFKKKAKTHEKESNAFYLTSLKVFERAVKTFEKALNPNITVRITKTYKMHYISYIEKIKGINAAFMYARKKGWFDIASLFAKKNKQSDLAEHYNNLYQQKMNKLIKSGTCFEEIGKERESKAQKYKKKYDKFIKSSSNDNSSQNNVKISIKSNLINLVLKPFKFIIASLYSYKYKKFLKNASKFYEKANSYFIQTEMLGKIAELQGKIYTIPKEYSDIYIESESSLLQGNSIKIFEIQKKLDDFIEYLEKANQKKFIKNLLVKKNAILSFIKKLKQADELEIRADGISKIKRKEKVLKKAMTLYEEIGCFKPALEIAKKINLNNLAECYELIVELSINS